MAETLTIKIDKELKETLRRRSRLMKEPIETLICQAIRKFVEEIEVLPYRMTLDEYRRLTNEEEEALWKEAFHEELDKPQPPEIEVGTDVITPQQRDIEELRQRLRQIRSQHTSNA